MSKTEFQIALLPGDGIGPEVVAQAKRVLDCLSQKTKYNFICEQYPFGGAAVDELGEPFPQSTKAGCEKADAILLGAVGGPVWDQIERGKRPERGLLAIRKHFGLFANLRPARVFPKLVSASTLREEVVSGVDLLVVRELTGGIYFGEPRGLDKVGDETLGFNTLRYSESEIRRIAHVAFQAAQKRRKQLTSVDKANVLESSELWRSVVISTSKKYPDVKLDHLYVDNAAMQLIKDPKQFDVILTGNLFGDILSDAAAMLTGSIGMLPSASLNEKSFGLYEPVHGSAPDIAGQGKANPLATILSVAMMLIHSFDLIDLGRAIEKAVENVLEAGVRTGDIAGSAQSKIASTEEMGDAVVRELEKILGV
ncbi:MAG: 3-isopropylmalate dehydrogenase [Deltaproteobacteria bacterium]|nr:3-isopropylmalate dehydrogenase [Deltaproteobacteria bacterium]